jgi:hypothetical protein
MTNADIKNKIVEGCKLAVRKLIDRKKRENSYLIFSERGKVVKVPATEVK